jgi:hypothetical protein
MPVSCQLKLNARTRRTLEKGECCIPRVENQPEIDGKPGHISSKFSFWSINDVPGGDCAILDAWRFDESRAGQS